MKLKAPMIDAVDFIQEPTLSQQTMRRFVKADQHPVHEMAGDEDQRHRQPVKAAIDGEAQRSLCDKENHYKQLERPPCSPNEARAVRS